MKTTKLSNETLSNMNKLEQENFKERNLKQTLQNLKKSSLNKIKEYQTDFAYTDVFTSINCINSIIEIFNKYHFNLNPIESGVYPCIQEVLNWQLEELSNSINLIETYDIDNILFYIEFLQELNEHLNLKIKPITEKAKEDSSVTTSYRAISAEYIREISNKIEKEDKTKLSTPIVKQEQYEETEQIQLGLIKKIKRALS